MPKALLTCTAGCIMIWIDILIIPEGPHACQT